MAVKKGGFEFADIIAATQSYSVPLKLIWKWEDRNCVVHADRIAGLKRTSTSCKDRRTSEKDVGKSTLIET